MTAPARTAPMPTAAEFGAWLARARPGERIVYHRGFLACDRADEDQRGKQAAKLARWAMAEAATGWVILVQRRIGWADHEYIAVKRGRRAAG